MPADAVLSQTIARLVQVTGRSLLEVLALMAQATDRLGRRADDQDEVIRLHRARQEITAELVEQVARDLGHSQQEDQSG